MSKPIPLSSNRLLASLAPEDGEQLASVSRIEHPSAGQVITSASGAGSDIWFPLGGAIALVTTDAGGRSVQTGMIGREGCVGLGTLFGEQRSAPDAVVQIASAMSVIPATQLKSALRDRPGVHMAMTQFLYLLSAQSCQTIACNRLHNMHARCCRWLLTMQDLIQSDDLPVTQETFSTLLGGGRPRVNLLLAELERDGVLRRHRGRIHLLERSELEEQSCECYHLTRDATESLFRDQTLRNETRAGN